MWQNPKINWQSTDYFNIEDYNRIKGNIIEIKNMASTIFKEFQIEDMGADKTYEDYSFYADEINLFEKNLDTICKHTYPFAIGESIEFFENQPFIDYKELNRLESASLLIYNNILGRIVGRNKLSFRLKGGIF